MRSHRSVVGVAIVCLVAGAAATAAAQGPEAVTFSDHIRPIMERSCWNCHGEAAQLSDLDLRTRESALEGGTRGPAIVPRRADESRLYRQLAGLEAPAYTTVVARPALAPALLQHLPAEVP